MQKNPSNGQFPSLQNDVGVWMILPLVWDESRRKVSFFPFTPSTLQLRDGLTAFQFVCFLCALSHFTHEGGKGRGGLDRDIV